MHESSRLQTGMTTDYVNRIIGRPCTELSRAEFGGSSTVMRMWEGTGSWLGNMNATFQNGRLMAKAQMGLSSISAGGSQTGSRPQVQEGVISQRRSFLAAS